MRRMWEIYYILSKYVEEYESEFSKHADELFAELGKVIGLVVVDVEFLSNKFNVSRFKARRFIDRMNKTVSKDFVKHFFDDAEREVSYKAYSRLLFS